MRITKFYRQHCSACDQADRMLKRAGIEYTSIDCETEEGSIWIDKLNIRSLPVILIENDDRAQKVLTSIQELKEWLIHN